MDVQKDNGDVLFLLARYLNETPDFITEERIRSVTDDPMAEERVFAVLLAAGCGLDTYGNDRDKELFRRYFLPAVKRLDPEEYEADAYVRHIRIPAAQCGAWEFREQCYRPYEAFVYDDPVTDFAGRIIPRIGFFPREYRYPAVLEGGREWMLITPNEINTMRSPIAAARGRVLTFGLGLGYFVYHASEKPEVESVTVVERDERVIRLFRDVILPQFPHGEKVQVVCRDAFVFAEEQLPGGYDMVFTDLWHDPSDGVALFRRMKKLQAEHPGPEYHYWIEKTLKLYGT